MVRPILIALACALPLANPALAADKAELLGSTKKVVGEFAKQLKGKLKGAIDEKGPIEAISVCNEAAPEIAQQLSSQYGWDVGRTSLKLRNGKNAPDSWELAVLNKFEERKAAGEDVKPMGFGEIVEEDGKKYFRFMKAIPTGKLCLKCHGSDIAAEIATKLDTLYPEDKARGFKAGDIRGAFTIKRPL